MAFSTSTNGAGLIRGVRPVILKSFVELQIADRKRLDGSPLGRMHAVCRADQQAEHERDKKRHQSNNSAGHVPWAPVAKLSGNLRCSSSPIVSPMKTTANTMTAKVTDPIALPNGPRARGIPYKTDHADWDVTRRVWAAADETTQGLRGGFGPLMTWMPHTDGGIPLIRRRTSSPQKIKRAPGIRCQTAKDKAAPPPAGGAIGVRHGAGSERRWTPSEKQDRGGFGSMAAPGRSLGLKVRMRCANGYRESTSSMRRCAYRKQLDLETMVCTRGPNFSLLGWSRASCVQLAGAGRTRWCLSRRTMRRWGSW